MTHGYKRNGTTTLFAALSMSDVKIIGHCMPRHRHQESIRFLKKINAESPPTLQLHLIVDNYSTHKHPRIQSWLRRHPRFNLHFTPTSGSWLNMVERWFRELTQKQIRRSSFHIVPALVRVIEQYTEIHNRKPQVFVWSAPFKRFWRKSANVKKRWTHHNSYASRE